MCALKFILAIAQIFLLLEEELKSQQTTQVLECHGGGYEMVCPYVLTMLQFTTNLREGLK